MKKIIPCLLLTIVAVAITGCEKKKEPAAPTPPPAPEAPATPSK